MSPHIKALLSMLGTLGLAALVAALLVYSPVTLAVLFAIAFGAIVYLMFLTIYKEKDDRKKERKS